MNIAFLHLHWGGGTYKGKKYKSYSLARSVRKNGKNRHKVELKLGKLTADEVNWWKKLLHIIKNPSSVITTLENIVTRKHYEYCALAVVNKFWDYWKLDRAFHDTNGKSDIPLTTIARILTVNRCVTPESKSAVPEWLSKTALPQQLNISADKINKSRIFRELKYIEKNKDNICDHLLAEYKQRFSDSLNQVYYDLSSTTFSGTKCIISKYGHCKEGFRTHVVLALLVTESGIPFYWEILPGGTADATTVEWLLEKCRNKFKELNITAVFDRGFVSDDNLGRFENSGIKYISAMDRNQLENICADQINFEKYSEFSPEKIHTQINSDEVFIKVNSTTYYREIKVVNSRRYILCFNPQLFIDQRNAREKSIKLFSNDILTELNDELESARKSRAYETTLSKFSKYMAKCKISSFAEIELNPLIIEDDGRKINSFQGHMHIDEKKKKSAMKMDGFWMLVTNLSEKNSQDDFVVSSEDALRPYREKVIIEDAFRDIKSFIEIAPVYVWLEKHIKAHYTICVLAYLINRTISNLLRENPGKLSGDIKTHCAVYKELSSCSIDEIYIKNLEQSNYCMTELNKKQKEILQRLKASGIANVNGILNKFRKNITDHSN
ncbi:MAG: IS1634 family transposase [Victivallaceae bacterium]|nr:IS1634 family transposase [Victivallaceae bacterium]